MKRLTFFSVLAVCFIFTVNIHSASKGGFDPKLKFNSGRDYSKEIKERDYKIASNFHRKIAGSVLGASVDLQLGYGTTNANVDANTSKTVNTTSKGGFLFGALLNINLFEILNFSTGLDFTKKNFGITVPKTDPLQGDSLVQNLENNYLNIPMNMSFSTMVSDKVGISFTGGPYIGFLLNNSSAPNGYKDFDFGLDGIITAKYFLNPFMAVILGTKGQYGGLNNLLNSGTVSKVNTFNWGAFTGLSLGF